MDQESSAVRRVRWVGDSRERLQEFPPRVRKDMGHALYLVQTGHTPSAVKPMRGMESGVFEVVDDYDTNTYRAVYTVKVGNSRNNAKVTLLNFLGSPATAEAGDPIGHQHF